MAQLKPILNVNSNFERGNTDGFTESLTGVAGAFLDRRDDRINPKRRVIEPLLKSRSAYIFNGRFSRRYTIAAAGDFELQMDTVPVEPGQIVTVGLVWRSNDVPAVFSLRLEGGATPVFVSPQNGGIYLPGEAFSYIWQTTTDVIDLTEPTATEALPLWQRIGFTVEIPMEVAVFDPHLLVTGPAQESVFDVGEFSVQGQLSENIHAGG
jgi:hypothetical protein